MSSPGSELHEYEGEGTLSVSDLISRICTVFVYYEQSTKLPTSIEATAALCARLLASTEWLDHETKSLPEVDDLSTGEIELIVLPAMLAFFEDKKPVANSTERRERLLMLVQLYKRYLYIAKHLHLSGSNSANDDSAEEEDVDDDGLPKKLVQLSPDYVRTKTIEDYRKQQNLFSRIASLIDADSDERRRDRAMYMIQYWILRAEKEIKLANDELVILRSAPRPQSSEAANNRLTMADVRSELKSRVFGLGYPSPATLQPGEWFDQKMARHAHESRQNATTMPEPPKPRSEEAEEEEKRQSDIRFEEYKDTHRRGDGNTYRKG